MLYNRTYIHTYIHSRSSLHVHVCTYYHYVQFWSSTYCVENWERVCVWTRVSNRWECGLTKYLCRRCYNSSYRVQYGVLLYNTLCSTVSMCRRMILYVQYSTVYRIVGSERQCPHGVTVDRVEVTSCIVPCRYVNYYCIRRCTTHKSRSSIYGWRTASMALVSR